MIQADKERIKEINTIHLHVYEESVLCQMPVTALSVEAIVTQVTDLTSVHDLQ